MNKIVGFLSIAKYFSQNHKAVNFPMGSELMDITVGEFRDYWRDAMLGQGVYTLITFIGGPHDTPDESRLREYIDVSVSTYVPQDKSTIGRVSIAAAGSEDKP